MWYSCSIPLAAPLASFPVASGIPLCSGIRLEPLPDWVKSDEALELLSWNDREHIRSAEIAFVAEYEADALGSLDPSWNGSQPRSVQQGVVEKFVLASLSLWLVRPSRLSCGPVLHFARVGDPRSVRQVSSLEPILVPDGEEENGLSTNDIRQAARLLEQLLSLHRAGTIWTAAWMLYPALRETLWQIRYLLEWVILESLFGPESPSETTYRLAQRIGLFVGVTREEKIEEFEKAKQGYALRSKVVHGRRLSRLTGSESLDLTVNLESVVRRALTKILLTPDLVKVFDSRNRDKYLDDLMFS